MAKPIRWQGDHVDVSYGTDATQLCVHIPPLAALKLVMLIENAGIDLLAEEYPLAYSALAELRTGLDSVIKEHNDHTPPHADVTTVGTAQLRTHGEMLADIVRPGGDLSEPHPLRPSEAANAAIDLNVTEMAQAMRGGTIVNHGRLLGYGVELKGGTEL